MHDNTAPKRTIAPAIKSTAHDNIVGINEHADTLGIVDTFDRKAAQLLDLLDCLAAEDDRPTIWLAGDLTTLMQQCFHELVKRHECVLQSINEDAETAQAQADNIQAAPYQQDPLDRASVAVEQSIALAVMLGDENTRQIGTQRTIEALSNVLLEQLNVISDSLDEARRVES